MISFTPSRIRDALSSKLALIVARRIASTDLACGIISFSFDDFPRSAYQTGAPILEAHGFRGTFYTALSRTGGFEVDPPYGAYHTAEDLLDLQRRGHELACHTFSHHDVRTVDGRTLEADLERNAQVALALGAEPPLQHFAYPFGRFSLSAKRLIGERFMSGRSTRRGINAGRIDLALLRANELYSRSVPFSHVEALIQETARCRGWLIFFTHDVQEHPSIWGSTPAYLRAAVQRAAEAGCEVLRVSDAVGRLMAHRQPANVACRERC